MDLDIDLSLISQELNTLPTNVKQELEKCLVATAFAIYIQSTGNLYAHNHKSSPKNKET